LYAVLAVVCFIWARMSTGTEPAGH
jgi:hypothetical protein